MDRSLYVAMSGAKQIEFQQATNTHNLANASTTGFRADFDTFSSLPVYGPGQPTRVYSIDSRAGVNFSAGPIVRTGRDLDISVNGSGFIAIQAPDGGEAYTRAGDLRVATGGLLQTGNGEPVIGNSGPIALPTYSELEIAADGTLSIIPIGAGAAELAVIDRIKLVNPPAEQLEKGLDGLIRSTDQTPVPADAAVQISNQTLESSNVNAVGELLNMIGLARRFEMHVQLMETVRDIDQSSATILRYPN